MRRSRFFLELHLLFRIDNVESTLEEAMIFRTLLSAVFAFEFAWAPYAFAGGKDTDLYQCIHKDAPKIFTTCWNDSACQSALQDKYDHYSVTGSDNLKCVKF